MRAEQIITAVTMVAFLGACNTEDYYRNANRPPVLTASVDLDKVDTIKTSAASSQRTYMFSVTAEDENGNMNTLMASATGGKAVIMVDEEPSREAIELSKERHKFIRQIKFTPNGNGLHVITAKVVDDFNTSRSVEKKVFSFINMRPKVNVTYTFQRPPHNHQDVYYTFDFSTSYDRDAKWGGKVDSFYIKPVFQWAIDQGYSETDASWVLKLSVDEIGYTYWDALYDDGIEWVDNVYCWVKDNEGAVSDTVRFSIGNVPF